jgi:uncharacterized surface protein with fasciclin (FAS1) repeats
MKYFKLLFIPAIMMMVACHKKGKREGMKRNGAKTTMHRMANKKSIGTKVGSILYIINHRKKLSMFAKTAKAAGEDQLLQKGNNYKHYTLFAPSNKAYKALSKKERKKLTNPDNEQELKKIVRYHMMSGILRSSDLKQGRAYKTLDNGKKVMISKYKGQLMINGAKIERKGIKARKGMIYIINKVLDPENH